MSGPHLGTVNARSMWDNAPALSDLVTSNGIDLLGIRDMADHERNHSRSGRNDPPGFLLLSGT